MWTVGDDSEAMWWRIVSVGHIVAMVYGKHDDRSLTTERRAQGR